MSTGTRTFENTGFCFIVVVSLTNTRATTVSERHSQTKGVDGMNLTIRIYVTYPRPVMQSKLGEN